LIKRFLTSVFLGLLLGGCTGVVANIQLGAWMAPQPTTVPSATSEPTQTSTPSPLPPTPTPTWRATSTATISPSPLPFPTATPTIYVQGPRFFPSDINPLTGLAVENPEILDRSPIAVKVTNFPRSVRPQWGLSYADHVYEYYIGDDMSRFIGIFYGHDASRVGPVRSARLFDRHVMELYQSVFVFGWADDPILETLLTPELTPRLVVERPGNCPPLCRIGPKYAYNNLYVDTGQVGSYLGTRGSENKRPDLSGLRFEFDTPKSGNPGEQFYLMYSLVSYHKWIYEPETGRYLRFQETGEGDADKNRYAPLSDSLTGTQLSADNVIILHLPHEYAYKSTSTEIIDQPIQGEGEGYAFRDGLLYPIHWQKLPDLAMLNLTLPNQRPYPLKPGNTWFEIIGESSTFELLENGSWNFTFSMP